MLAALVWWFISLEQQNETMTNLRLSALQPKQDNYLVAKAEVLDFNRRKHAQYVGEGFIFMLLILVGAVVVFGAIRKQLRLGQQQQNFTMAVTHELKTPISIAKLNLETLKKRKLDDAQKDRLIGSTIEETNRLNDLTNNILLVSKLDNSFGQSNSEMVDFSFLVKEVVSKWGLRYPERKIVIQTTNVESLYVKGDKMLLRILVDNLLSNAIKYATMQGNIEVRLLRNNKGLCLKVSDDGPGIPDNEKKSVFRKFYRIGNENTRLTKGTGLGLYLCKKICTAHKGSIQVGDRHPNGAVLIVELPAYQHSVDINAVQ